jgi:hypothetical protein
MKKESEFEPAPMARVVSTGRTTVFPDLGLELPADVPVLLPASHLATVLAMPGVTLIPE